MTDRELERRANRRLAVLRHVEEVSGNVAATCRYYGISRQCYYGWLRRFEADGLDGLKDRSSRPHHSPRVTLAARLAALPTPGAAVEALREAAPRPSAAGGCEVHRTTRPNRPPEEVLPVHRYR